MSKIIIANWKMNGNGNLAKEFNQIFQFNFPNLVICPPSNLLGYFTEGLTLGAQDCATIPQEQGAFTGELSAKFLSNSGVKYIIIGHSERRINANENNDILKQKLLQLSESQAIPVFCIGENLEQYQSNQTLHILRYQLSILKDLSFPQGLLLAYEPVWSIGSGKIPTTEILTPLVKNIKEMVSQINNSIEKNCKILYGGSVTEHNIEQIANWPVDGFLVGGASLDSTKLKIIYSKTNT